MTINVNLSQITPSGDGKYYEAFPSGDANVSFGNAALGGTITNDTITVTTDGTYNFGTKANAKPLVYNDFENQINPISLGLRAAWTSTGSVALSSTQTTLNSSQSLRWDAAFSSDGSLFLDALGSPDQLYVFRRTYDDFDIVTDQGGSGFNLKRIRLWRELGGDSSNNNNIYFGYQGSEGNGSVRVFAENTSAGGASFASQPVQAQGQWVTQELAYTSSDLDTQNGTFDIYEDGVLWESGNTFTNITTARPNKYNQISFDQVSNGTAAGPLYMYFDEIYIDDTFQRVMVAAESTWSSATKKQILIPSAWSSSSITVTERLGEFSTLSGLYLYVIDANNSVLNENGVLIP